MIYPLIGAASADALYMYLYNIPIPKNIDAFLSATPSHQAAVGGLAGICAVIKFEGYLLFI